MVADGADSPTADRARDQVASAGPVRIGMRMG